MGEPTYGLQLSLKTLGHTPALLWLFSTFTILYFTILYYTILYYTNYTILYYTILYYTILYYNYICIYIQRERERFFPSTWAVMYKYSSWTMALSTATLLKVQYSDLTLIILYTHSVETLGRELFQHCCFLQQQRSISDQMVECDYLH